MFMAITQAQDRKIQWKAKWTEGTKPNLGNT